MKKHSGMRPHDIAILMKIASLREKQWLLRDLSMSLLISASEVSESLNRSVYAGLLSVDKKNLMKQALLEFVQHGLKYVFPVKPGPIVRGLPTAHSASPLKFIIQSQENFVWPWAFGKVRGQAIEPLYPKVPIACNNDEKLYELLALTDAIRVGKAREQEIAVHELKMRIV